jgi:hypothetical protein
MARGWESKAVSDQIEEAAQRAHTPPSKVDRSPEKRLYRQQLEALRLSRSRTLAQLKRASSPAYRQMLEQALAALEARIDEISQC